MNDTEGDGEEDPRMKAHRIFQQTQDEMRILCEKKIAQFNQNSDSLEGYCPPFWDSILCWPQTWAGELRTQPCPEYVNTFDPHNFASRQCEEDGQWYKNPRSNSSWTNYTLCHGKRPDDVSSHNISLAAEWIPIVKKMSQVGYAVSFVALILALAILVSIKRLRCPRNTLHMHLFASFLLRALMALLKAHLFVDGVGLPGSIIQDEKQGLFRFNDQTPNWECKLVTSIWQYFLVANYTWILMEGLYLHNLIFLAPFSDSSAISLYIILGWGCPFFVVGGWVLARIYSDNTLCWTTHVNNNHLFLIIRIPIIISIVLNFVFFLNIVRVLLLKLQSSVSVETRKFRYRKWARSTLVLVPLFGVHYMVFIGMSFSEESPVLHIVWLFCDQLFASFQGFFVAILYCLLNGEVNGELKKIWNTFRERNKEERHSMPLRQLVSSRSRNCRSTNDDMLTTNGLTLT